ncbi:AAA family ATPase [Rhizobium sp. 2YAF20]|uniref:AAA family ATPase n=1 Tax=Rhizobium sp. 2YAF20 TaxID=3233027 RepID=UPI003F963D56
MLIIFGGLPGSGKTTIARALAQRLSATYVRVDTIEQAIRASGVADDVGPAGYIVAYGVAGDNLALGRTVIADSVNALQITRDAWLAVARTAGVRAVEVEVLCSDKTEHRRRVETRATDVEGLVKPTWREISERAYDDWQGRQVVVDTASKTVDAAIDELLVRLNVDPVIDDSSTSQN